MSDKPLTDLTFSSFELHPALQAGLEGAGFTRCTPIQALTLPVALPGGDVAGQAQTGTGKTLAFLVAVVNRLLTRPALADRKPEDPRALILAPTRELAIQIHKDAVKFGSDLGLRFALVYGGVDYDKQRELLQQGVDVIIATPGRLIDYVKQHKVVSLHACEICVLDEADRMFDLGFIKDIRFLLRRMPERTTRQTLLFSATLSHRVLELAYEHMNEPQKLVVEAETITAARVRQRIYFPADDEKIPLLLGLLSRSEGARTMVFVNTKVFVERVARSLEKAGYRVGVLSGDVPQKKRESLLNRFQKGQLEILVATDVAARGLHIDGIKYVYNYDLPFDAEDYVHRIGRTARLGEEGDAISFACERYAMGLPDIEAYIEQKIPSEPVTKELLTPLPRPERPAPAAGEEGEDNESVGQIFREAREARAAEEERRGGGRSGGRSGGGGRGGRDGERSGERRSRGPRKPRVEGEQGAAAPAAGAEGAVAQAPRPPRPPRAEGAPEGAVDGEHKPRKRRRRRHGRPVEGAEGVQSAAGNGASPVTPVQVVAKPVRTSADTGDSFLTRIGRKIRRMLSGN
ncbi:ATP-dependent RNA helicase RhlB [Stenotrophomonas maltophilia]|jgi:ATP-dependent RNA helicase RhlB|uniref:ATP-dependent RNA helicase RhlB n=1 Tax=Stenotrophomonas geniculata TaxID=86188 RepID=UPI00066DA532|nr:ATP-dependent RNA helicase RhlB [Stenotrophomonas geniculata]MBH1405931.1 ATP-dependent RNA helicase RhlB [Stenotrophomonas maltophilia]MBN4972015.1 ATP-dependent RNA helicase RhlB [Stenotrophomonas maltophilia]MBN5130090.1 ATP-dependent RNA helicase RhlB [Stenotrophomonas maltophilia]MBN5135468.1 ATP-dependent RNA helicase RhlB [Stenotrophomonas maltophilia]MCF3476533.1 ATP-dependent RNA helicase RhlB [Stenotrophomonas maltophilia]